MAFNFTKDQRMALEFPGNVIVSAGAGSGKTRVLVEKYFRMLVDQHPEWPVDSVVAITFTRKAAAELKSRIIARVLMELETEPEGTKRQARLQMMRAEVGAAPIGTIHTFCGRILREFAFDAHLDPDYMVIEGAQEGALRLNAARETIAEATASKGQEIYTDLLALLNVFSAGKLNEILAGMLAGRTNYLAPAGNYVARSVEELFAELLVFHKEYADTLRREIGREWKSLLQQLANRSQPGKVKDIAGAAAGSWPEDWVTDWESCSQILEGVLAGIFTQKCACRKKEFKQAGIEESDPLCAQLAALCEKHKNAQLDNPDEDDRSDIELSRRLARLFLRAVDIYEQMRGGDGNEGEAQLMDFSDLEIFAERLISSSAELRNQIRSRYPFLIIDEFQDTSQSQWDILKQVVIDEDGSLRPNSLFVVGDRKQGVYGFRDANVTLFSQVQNLVTESNSTWEECRGFITMAENFRTNPGPLTFINNVFENLLSEASNAYSVVFEPLTAMKHESEGCVEYLLSCPEANTSEGENEDEASLNAAEHKACEAGLVAAHIKALVESGDAKPGDIALLFRKKSVFADYELALKALGISCVTQQGDNLFHQPELADVVAALNSVVYPHRDLVFVHYLRSPFVGCSDDLLLKIARSHGRSFWDKANLVLAEGRYQLDSEWHTLTALEKDRISFAVSVLRRARQLVGTVPPYDVLKFVVDELGASHTVLAGFRGKQAVANIDKLLLLARSAEALSFEDFLEFIKSEEESLKGTAEAVDLTTSDAVRIMTIHAAKGLEFPVVYLPDLNSGTSGRGHDVYGDGEKWMTLVPPRDYAPKRSFLAEYFRMVGRKQQEAEERRVFYVAMTRCENRLVLCASPNAKSRGETFYQWIAADFENGKAAGKLKSQKDFPSISAAARESAINENPKTAGRGTQEQRYHAALTSADAFAQSSQRPSDLTRDDTINLVLSLLPRYMRATSELGTDHAQQELANQLAGMSESAAAQVLERLVKAAHLIQQGFADTDDLQFFPHLRFTYSGKVLRFQPHIQAGNRCVWIALGDSMRTKLEEDVRRYAEVVEKLSGAPRGEIWVLSDEAISVGS